jgi:methoxymalonate biosynthesis acyl carrier protein
MEVEMESENIKLKLRQFIRESFKVPENDKDFNDDVHLFDYGYIDSFGAVELTAFVAKSFSVKVSQSDLVAYPMNTINEIVTFVSARLKGAC